MAARRTMRKQLVVSQADNASGERSFYPLLHAHCYRQQAGPVPFRRSRPR